MIMFQAMGHLCISKIDVEKTPDEINFTKNNKVTSSYVFADAIKNNKWIKIKQGGNCIFDINKVLLEIERRIIGNWY